MQNKKKKGCFKLPLVSRELLSEESTEHSLLLGDVCITVPFWEPKSKLNLFD